MTDDPDKGDRIAKVIARAGLASRRDAERMIEAGRVAVNGRVIDSPALALGSRDRVTVDGRPLPAPEGARLWLYHKPPGLVTTERDEKDRETVFDALRERLGRVLSVGRLDLTSEGLLLLTNDGDLKRRLELPETGWLRRYRVRVKGAPDEAALARLREGVEVDGERFQGMQVALDRQQGANAWLTVGLREGRNREVRRAAEAVGLTVNRLIRVSYGPFQLGKLGPGEVEEVRPRVAREQMGALWDGEFAEARRDESPRAPRHEGDRLMDHGRGKPGGKAPRGPKGKGGPGPRADKAGARPDKPRTAKPPVTRNDGPDVGGRSRGKPGGTRDAKPGGDRKGGPRADGGKPWEKRGPRDGDRPRGKPSGDRPNRPDRERGDDAPRRDAKPWDGKPRRDRPAREDGPRDGKPWERRPRRDGAEGDRRGPAKPRAGKPGREDGDRPARPRRDDGPRVDRPRRDAGPDGAQGGRPFKPRRDDAPRGDRPRRDGAPDGSRGDRPYKPRRSDAASGDRPRRDEGAPRPFKPRREGGSKDAPGGRPSKPRREDGPGKPSGAKPRRDDRPEAPRQTKGERKAAMRADTSVSLRKGGQRGRGISKPKPAGGKSYVKPAKPKP